MSEENGLSPEIDEALQALNDAGVPCEIEKGDEQYVVRIFEPNSEDVWSMTSRFSPEACIEWIKTRGANKFKHELKNLKI